jgi:hypothetical protein
VAPQGARDPEVTGSLQDRRLNLPKLRRTCSRSLTREVGKMASSQKISQVFVSSLYPMSQKWNSATMSPNAQRSSHQSSSAAG